MEANTTHAQLLPPRRSRHPHGPVPASSERAVTTAPALLELAAATPMFTDQRHTTNFFVPDAQMLFHVLSICDQMMNSTYSFLRSSPAWMPIVSQLYISVLWNVMIISVFTNSSGHGSAFSSFLTELFVTFRIGECMIPGPLVPFLQSLEASKGPFNWIGDIVPGLPSFSALWNERDFHVNDNYARLVPLPALILDQLHYFSQFAIPANQQSTYTTFEWYRNVFSQGLGRMNRLNRIGPQLCGSLFTSQSQYDAARNYWNASLCTGITRSNAADGQQPAFTNYRQLFGFESQNGEIQLNWFTSVSIVMNKYTQYFKDSVPLKSILPVGIGSVAIYGAPVNNPQVREWIYPPDSSIDPFTTSRYPARREIPNDLAITFSHAYHELDEQSEQYAVLTHTNIKWFTLQTQNNWQAFTENGLYTGEYWHMIPHRHSQPICLKSQFAQIIASRYHRLEANQVE